MTKTSARKPSGAVRPAPQRKVAATAAVESVAPETVVSVAAAELPDSVPAADSRMASAKAGADGTQLVTFLLKDEEFGFDIMSVQEIIRLPKMAKLPHTPEYVEGISNLRGAVLPIVDIRARFGMRREERTDRSRVLVIDIDGKRTGLLVDGVRQVARVGRNEFEPPPTAIRSETADYIDGVVKLDKGERIIIALDARRVCSFGTGAEGGGTVVAAKPSETASASGAHGHATDPGEEQGRGTKGKGVKVNQLVSFQVGREEFAFPMEHVREILRVQTPKEVPGAPDHLLGVLTVRGQILPIVDLRRLLRQRSYAEDTVEACRHASEGYKAWLGQSGGSTGGGSKSDLPGALAASERLRTWLSVFNSSSQALMETLARVRSLNEHVTKQAGGQSRHGLDANGAEALRGDVEASAKAIVSALRTFQEQVEGNVREDQRIIVVDSNGFLLGLVVDHVNEVLGVQDDAIEAPPNLSHHEGISLSGIAKLDEGNRLILLLATNNLLDRQKLTEIAAGLEEKTLADHPKHDEAKEAGASQAGEDLQLVTFLLGKEEYGIPIARIQEIDRLSKITQTPRAPKFVEGVTNLRGEVIPVLSTRTLFALENKDSDDRTRVIIVDLGGAKTGLVVDSVREVLSIPARNIAPPPASISSGPDGKFISGIGKVENGKRMIVLLDVGRVLTGGEQREVAALAQAV